MKLTTMIELTTALLIGLVIGNIGTNLKWSKLAEKQEALIKEAIATSKSSVAIANKFKDTLSTVRDQTEIDAQNLRKCLIANGKLRENK